MAQGRITPLNQMTRNITKLEREVRTEIENQPTQVAKKPKPTMVFSKEERKMFSKIVKLNDSFSEADSISITQLTRAMHRHALINEAMDDLDVMDERNVTLERRALAYDKAISQHMTALSIPLTQRLRMANDMAKVMIEERKLEQMKSPELKEVNPLLNLLEAMK